MRGIALSQHKENIMKVKIFIIFLVVLLLPLTFASDTQHRFKVNVHVRPESDTDLHDRLEAFIKRELRSLGDVDIVSFSSDWKYHLLYTFIELEAKDGRKTGWLSIATAAYQAVPKHHFDDYNGHETPLYYRGLASAYWDKDNLHEYAIQNVSSFDEQVLELEREINRKYFD